MSRRVISFRLCFSCSISARRRRMCRKIKVTNKVIALFGATFVVVVTFLLWKSTVRSSQTWNLARWTGIEEFTNSTTGRISVEINPSFDKTDFGKKLEASLFTVTISCNRLLRLSTASHSFQQLDFPSPEASEWPICADDIKKNCLIYSAKIGGLEIFEEAAILRLGCDVFLFDPSLDKEDLLRIKSNGIMAFDWALATINATIVTGVKKLRPRNYSITGEQHPGNGSWNYKKAGDVIHKLAHSEKTIDILRLDLHGGEWDVLNHLATNGILSNIHQIVMSVHVWRGETVFSIMDRFMKLKKLASYGFHLFYSKPMFNMGQPSNRLKCCHIVGWMKMTTIASGHS